MPWSRYFSSRSRFPGSVEYITFPIGNEWRRCLCRFRVVPLFTFKVKTPNFCPPAVDFWIAASYLKAPALPTLVFCLRVFVCLLLANPEQSAQCYTFHDTERHWVLSLWRDMTCVAPQRRAKCFIKDAFQLVEPPSPLDS